MACTVKCPACNGVGVFRFRWNRYNSYDGYMHYYEDRICPRCRGAGLVEGREKREGTE